MASEKCKLFKFLLALGLLAVLGAVVEVCLAEEHPDANFYYYLRPRLGHLGTSEEWTDAYEEYFENVIKHEDKLLKNLNVNDWRRGRPTGKHCVVYLQDFQVRSYKLSKPFDILILDACLDWILADPKEVDSEKKLDYDLLDSELKGDADELAADPKLKEIFTSTQFKSASSDSVVPIDIQQEIHSYLSRLLKINADNPKNWCHSLWMEAYNDFIEELYLRDCEHPADGCKFYGIEGSQADSYLKMIAESTTNNLKTCYNVVQKQMVSIMRKDYQEKSGLNLFVTSGAAKQAKRMRWGQEMVKILQLASGTSSKDPIQLSDVVIDLNNIKYEDEETIERFTKALGQFALSNVNLKETQDDEKGLKRYRKAMTKLCLPYINPKEFFKTQKTIELGEQDSSKKPFEFYNLIYNLIRMTNHEQLLAISKTQFEEDVLQKGWAPLYLATFACQIISTTWGTIDYTENEEAFAVSLRPNAQVLIEDWPIDLLVERLADDEPAPNDDFEEAEESNDVEIIYRKSEPAPTKKPRDAKTTTTKKPKSLKIKSKTTPAPKSSPQPGAPEEDSGDESAHKESKTTQAVKSLKKWMPKWGSSDRKSKSSQQPVQQIIQQVVNLPQGTNPVINQFSHQSYGKSGGKHQTATQHIEFKEPEKPKAAEMSIETIRMFYQLHGRLPKLEPINFEKYPELDKLRGGQTTSRPEYQVQQEQPREYSIPRQRFDEPQAKFNHYEEPSNYNRGPDSRFAPPQEQRYQSEGQYRNNEFMYNTRANQPAYGGGYNDWQQPMMRQDMEASHSRYEPSYMKPEFGYGNQHQHQEFSYNKGAPNHMGGAPSYGFDGPVGRDSIHSRGMQAGSNKASNLFF